MKQFNQGKIRGIEDFELEMLTSENFIAFAFCAYVQSVFKTLIHEWYKYINLIISDFSQRRDTACVSFHLNMYI